MIGSSRGSHFVAYNDVDDIDIRDFDRNMGPYPLDPSTYYERWKKLTNYISSGLVRRILPNNGRVSHIASKSTNEQDILNLKDVRMGKATEKEEGMEFTPFDIRKSFPKGATGQEVTKWSLDKSWLAKDLIDKVYHKGNGSLLLFNR